MSDRPLRVVVLGLSLSSSWGNGHATTYRALLSGLAKLGHEILFLERDVPWYAAHRDLAEPDFCRLAFYHTVEDLEDGHGEAIETADAVVVGSYVPDGIAVLELVLKRARGAVGFYDIDTPVTLAKLARGEHEYLSPALIPHVDLYLSFTGGPTLRRLEQEFGARRAVALYCAVDETRYRATGASLDFDLGFLGTYSPDRQPVLERLLIEPARLLPDQRFIVVGPQFPADIAWPANVQRLEHLSPEAHADFYSRLRFTLNVTRADMVAAGWSPSVRLFEAAACGTPIISDDWNGLGELLPDGEAVVVARSPADVVRALTGMADERRLSLGGRARAIVLQQHTGLARSRELEAAILGALPGARSRRAATSVLTTAVA